MANLSTILTRVQLLIGDNPTVSGAISSGTIQSIVQAEHDTLLNDYSWGRRKADTVISLVPTYTTGTVVTSGTTVTGTGTTFDSTMVGRFIKIGSRTFFHRITVFNSATSLTIESALPANVTTASNYSIFRSNYNLPTDFGRVSSATADIKLREWSHQEIDRIDPYRSATASRPAVYAVRGLDPDNTTSQVFQIEFWPVPSAAHAVRLEYLKTNNLTAGTDQPLYRSDVLIWKSGETAAFYLHSKTGDIAWLSLADRFHQRYMEALQGAKEDDLGKYSTVEHVRDTPWGFGLGVGASTDFWLDHSPPLYYYW